MREGTLRNLAKRLLYALISIVGVAALVFALLHVVPGNPVAALLGDRADPEKVERVSKALGLDQPLYVQFGNYLLGALHGDFGESYTLGKPVS
jgi:ABC-type dipeptide/oligopeptide/nickel transport system permease component